MPATNAYRDSNSRFTELHGVHVHFKREGRGPIVVLLHGNGSFVAHLATSCQVIRLDLPGFGLTGPRQDRDCWIEAYVDFLKSFLARLGISPVVLAGNSLGGKFALTHPTDVRRLVLMNVTGYQEKTLPLAFRLARSVLGRPLLRAMISRRSTAANLRKLVGPRMKSIPGAMVDRVFAMMKRPGNFQAFVDLANTPQRDKSGRIPEIKVPTLVLRGDLIDGQHFTRDIAGSREIVYVGVGHLLPDEVPSEVAAAIREESVSA
ncbi:MAG: hypothetical protein CBARDMAM_7396 [uncultured Caballeronia sp.]|nr:MAG: hypothetical protein CBARDMAM_7396 [uncultured Caballeronia sp.]